MSYIAKPYPPPGPPGLISGTAASNAAGAGTVKKAGAELAKNSDLARATGDLAK